MAPERPRRKPQVFPEKPFPPAAFCLAAAAAILFLSDQKETKESPGVSFVRKALRLCLALSLTIPPVPRFTGEPEGCVGNPVRRGALLKGV